MQRDGHAQRGNAATTSDPLSGRLLDGRYKIGSRIARGGMASVYEARDVRLDRVVAVKVMHPGLGDDDEFAARFVREARAAARLSHPNVVAVYDQGNDDGTVFLAMEMVQGHTLRDVIRKESPMSAPKAVAVLEPVLSAIAAAHRAGLIHRDVKPENVLIADDGRVKVADFGLAKAISSDTQHTATGGVLIGTVSYLAPELVVDGKADARADVYAAGVVLYELLTGTKPHEGDSPIHVAYKHVHEDVSPPSTKVPDIPAYVDALVARATARDQGQRPADAGVLLHHLHRVSQALAAGVRSDPELEADLAPRPLPTDTAPDPLDGQGDIAVAELAALMAPGGTGDDGREHTTAIDRNPTNERVHAVEKAPPLPDLVEPDLPPERRRPRRSKRGPLILLLALLLVAGAGFAAWWYGWARYTSAPGVIGMSQAAAVERISDAGLDAEVGDRTYSETVPEGRVIETDPPAGDRLLDGGTVILMVSRGKERYDVPQLKGQTEDEAQDALTQRNLEFGESSARFSEKVPKGRVITSDPDSGTTLPPGAVVDLVMSKGRKPIEVGDWVGKDADRAERVLEKHGLEVDRDQEAYSDDIPEGAVVSQTPSGGTLHRGDQVSIVVSLGPELVAVPDGLVASGVQAARQALEAAGFEVETERADSYIGIGYVYRVDPPSGTMVPQGSTVTLSLL